MQDLKEISDYRLSLRERILETAMTAFAQKGVRAVRMDDIAQLLSISKRTLYEIFENKEVLLFEGVKKFKAQKDEELMELNSESADVMEMILRIYKKKVEEFKEISPLFYEDIVRYPSVTSFLESDRAQGYDRFRLFLQRGVNEGYFRNDIDYDLVLSMFDAAMKLIVGQQLYLKYSVKEIFQKLVFVLLRGFCTKQGTDKLDTLIP